MDAIFINILIIALLMQKTEQQQPYRYLECPNTDEMIHGGPKIHGRVEKRGILPLHLWWNVSQYDNFKNVNEKLLEDELEFSAEDNSLSRAQQPLRDQLKNFPMSTRCQVFIDTDNKIIYMKNAKTGGSSLTSMIQRVCQEQQQQQQQHHVAQTDSFKCLTAPEFVEIKDPEIAKQIWKDYFVFTTIRNPYSRAASGFQYLLKRREILQTDLKFGCQKPTFETFSLNPFILGVQSQKFGCTDNEIHDYLHVEEETQCLFTENGEFAVDYIFSIENFAEDWDGLVNELIKEQALNYTRSYYFLNKLRAVEVKHVNSVSSGREYANQLYSQCGIDCINNIANYYSKDFETLGYRDCLSAE